MLESVPGFTAAGWLGTRGLVCVDSPLRLLLRVAQTRPWRSRDPIDVRQMPYEVSFSKRVQVVDREQYINDCCIGGDVVVNRLLPSVRARYTDVQTNQEDWGWFIWFRKGNVRLAIDIFTDDPDEGAFRVHLTSRTKRLLVLDTVVDTSELEELRTLVASELAAWVVGALKITRLDRNYSEHSDEV